MLDRLINISNQYPTKVALQVRGESIPYSQLVSRASAWAASLISNSSNRGSPLTAVFAYRSATAYLGVLAALLRGRGFVPLNRTFPTERSAYMLRKSECREMIVDAESAKQLAEVLTDELDPMLILVPDSDCVDELRERWPRHRFVGRQDLSFQDKLEPVLVGLESIAYVLFTSGSTGQPKGVMVTRGNVEAYVNHIVQRYGINSEDRCSQTFDMTFDLSVHDMFTTWSAGACLCVPDQKVLIKPGTFIRDENLTIWFSVPSTVVFMKRLGMLKSNSYPMLRLSLFCGEALPSEVAKAWSCAAPMSVLENIYGPTELTIACTGYRWDNVRSPSECEQGVVPIGEPFPGMQAVVNDEEGREVSEGEIGELLMTGPQLSPGYWRDSERTAKVFVTLPGRTGVWYKTGDRVRRPFNGQPITYIGRMDNQLKVLGHRVELGEIEAVAREVSGNDGIVAVGWPPIIGGAAGIELFIQAEAGNLETLRKELSTRLPAYMLPRNIHFVATFPLNSNGKFDRGALIRLLGTSPSVG